ncbi:hypothetical protein SUGI_0695940 [Cryptomeria japonica]|nr:hypothetical protein SUGI_0695940 [Cryptomeria japonica]
MPGILGCSAAEVRLKIDSTSPENLKDLTMKLYKALEKNGLAQEADKAFRHLKNGSKSGSEEQGLEEGLRKEQLLGMDYLMRDGIINYLCNVSRITPPIPQQVVKFSGLKYSATVELPSPGYETFGKKLLGCFFGPFKSLYKRNRTINVQILQDIDGYIMPGSMTLLLGPPGSGKSSLLKILAGRSQETKDVSFEGFVSYNDKKPSEIVLTRFIAYINGQLNKHIPFLSVRETLEFARDCTQGLRPENFTPQMRKFFAQALVEGQDPFLEYVLQILDLKAVEFGVVGVGQDGNGITENDREKLTTAELALGTYAVMLYDQPCSGNDSRATFELVSTLRSISRIQRSSAVMSITQLSEEVFNLFDRVILLGKGQTLYQGPVQDAIPYFSKLGYVKPAYVDSGAFLEDIAAGEGSQYLMSGNAALSLHELVYSYKESDHYRDLMRIVHGEDVNHTFWVESEPNIGLSVKTPSISEFSASNQLRPDIEVVVAKLPSKTDNTCGVGSTGKIQEGDIVTGISINNEEMNYLAVGSSIHQRSRASEVYNMLKNARGHVRLQVERHKEEEDDDGSPENKKFQREYVQGWWASTKTLIRRQMLITKRLQMLIKLRLFQACVLGLFAGSAFYKMGGNYSQVEMNSVRALGFVTIMNVMLINLVQLPLNMLQRPIFYKQRSQRFFRVSSYCVAHSVVNLPQTLLEALVYSLCVYFLSGLSLEKSGAIFFEYLFLLFLVAYFGSSLVFLLSAIAPITEAGNAFAGLVVSIFLLFSGFVIYPNNIPGYWKWLLYINPLYWANTNYCIMQFAQGYGRPCSEFENELVYCKTFPAMSVGKAYLKYYQLLGKKEWLWVSYAILLGWILLTNILALIAMKKIEFKQTNQSLPQQRKVSSWTKADEDVEEISGYSYITESSIAKSSEFSFRMQPSMIEMQVSNPSIDDDSFDLYKSEEGIQVNGNLNIPVMPVILSFENITFTRPDPRTGGRRVVLDGVSGYTKPGTTLALIGSSKSGKTTLLKCLAGRTPIGDYNGEILVNGFKMNLAAFSRLVGFAERLDAHQPFLSVKETLQFSASLRLGHNIDPKDSKLHVEFVLESLGLKSFSDQLIGSLKDATGWTFDIAKKITIAVELAANPSILFLDEPTSGLDSVGATNILNTIKSIASNSNRTVISTMKHPSARMLSTFNNVIILTSGGQQVYFGPVGFNCKDVLEYFVSIPKVPQYFVTQNPISFVLDVVGAGIKKQGLATANFAEIYHSSKLALFNTDEMKRLQKQSKRKAFKPVFSSPYPSSYKRQAVMVFLRTQRFLWRNVNYTFGRLTGCIMIGFLMGSLYFQIEFDDVYGLTSRTLYIYMQIILIGVVSANNVIPQLGTDRLVYFKERRAGMYAPIFYPLSWAVAEIPYFLIATFAIVLIGNNMAGLAADNVSNFVRYWLCLFIFTVSVTYFGMMLTFLAPVPTLAAFAVSILTSIWVSSSGVVVTYSKMSGFLKALFWSNPFQYAINTLTSLSFFCDTQSPQCLQKCTQGELGCPPCKCQRLPDNTFAWDRLKDSRSISEGRIPADFGTLTGMCIIFAGLAFIFFVSLKHNSRPSN